jgi:hypothetical protein
MKRQLNLGEFITRLESISRENEDNQNMPVVINMAGVYATMWRSYRGDYSQLALSFGTEEANDSRLAYFIDRSKLCLNSCLEGYKGGSYNMTGKTLLWVSKWGESSGYAIVGVKVIAGNVVIKTKWMGFY